MIPTTTMITLEIENTNRRRAEAQRMADSHALAIRLAGFTADLSQPRRLIDPVSRLPWSLTDPATDARTLAILAAPRMSAADTPLALVDTDGRPRAIEPPGAAVPFPAHSPIWGAARDNGLTVPVLAESGEARIYSIVPVRRAGRSVAFLVLGRTLHGPPGAEIARALGRGNASTATAGTAQNLGMTISIVDGHGRAAISNDATTVGRIVLDPGELRTIRPGHSKRVTARDSHGSPRISVATEIPSSPAPAYLVLRLDYRGTAGPQPNHALSDLLLVAIVVVTVAGLTRAILRQDQAIRRDGARLQTLLHESHDIIINLNRAGCPTFISSAIENLLGYPVQTRIGLPLVELVHPEDRAGMHDFLAERHRGNPASLLDIRLGTADGGYRWFDIEVGVWRPASGPGYLDGGLLLTCHEVGERRQLQEQLRQRATRDPLTGLANRLALTELLDCLARQQTPFTILLVDLDDFKPVNDTFGHQTGDDVLRTIAARLTEVLRSQRGRTPNPEPADHRPADEAARRGGLDAGAATGRHGVPPRRRRVRHGAARHRRRRPAAHRPAGARDRRGPDPLRRPRHRHRGDGGAGVLARHRRRGGRPAQSRSRRSPCRRGHVQGEAVLTGSAGEVPRRPLIRGCAHPASGRGPALPRWAGPAAGDTGRRAGDQIAGGTRWDGSWWSARPTWT